MRVWVVQNTYTGFPYEIASRGGRERPSRENVGGGAGCLIFAPPPPWPPPTARSPATLSRTAWTAARWTTRVPSRARGRRKGASDRPLPPPHSHVGAPCHLPPRRRSFTRFAPWATCPRAPLAVQRRGTETLSPSARQGWQIYNCDKLRLVMVGPQFGDAPDIRARGQGRSHVRGRGSRRGGVSPVAPPVHLRGPRRIHHAPLRFRRRPHQCLRRRARPRVDIPDAMDYPDGKQPRAETPSRAASRRRPGRLRRRRIRPSTSKSSSKPLLDPALRLPHGFLPTVATRHVPTRLSAPPTVAML